MIFFCSAKPCDRDATLKRPKLSTNRLVVSSRPVTGARHLLLSIAAVSALTLTGCVTDRLQQISGPKIGCAPDDIEIDNYSDANGPAQTAWQAKCDGKWYQCAQVGNVVNCQYFKRRDGYLYGFSAGQTGCAPEEIEIHDYRPPRVEEGRELRVWKATCRGIVFQCSAYGTSGGCKPVPRSTPSGLINRPSSPQQPEPHAEPF